MAPWGQSSFTRPTFSPPSETLLPSCFPHQREAAGAALESARSSEDRKTSGRRSGVASWSYLQAEGVADRPETNPGRPGRIKACASSPGPAPSAGAGTRSPGTPLRHQDECLEEGAGSQESVPARWSYSCEPSEAPPASPGLQIGEPVPGRARVGANPGARPRPRARARASPATAQGEGKPRQPVRGTGVKPPTNFNCQSDLMGY